jgi:hypothetical protein
VAFGAKWLVWRGFMSAMINQLIRARSTAGDSSGSIDRRQKSLLENFQAEFNLTDISSSPLSVGLSLRFLRTLNF